MDTRPDERARDGEDAAVFDFVDQYLEDLEEGRVRTLAEYLARYPGSERGVAREFLALTAEGPAQQPGSADGDGRRVGPYRLIEGLGRGGQGAVFLAEDTRIARRVALKLLSGGFVSEEHRDRLRREAETIARLQHAGICGILEADVDGGVPYIAMRHVDGEDLRHALAAAREREAEGGAAADDRPRVPWRPRDRQELHRVLSFFERAARALHAAHEAGVIHRDVKPSNLMVGTEGEPVLLDFGLAHDADGGQADLTPDGQATGTPHYMSPEQVRGDRADVDRRTDVYSLGLTLYEGLTLARPFEGDRVDLQRAILERPVPDARALVPAVGEDVQAVLETALEKDPTRRYSTALELAEDLRRIREYEPIRARRAGALLRFRRWMRREPTLATAVLGTLAILSVGLALSLWAGVRERRALRFALGRHLAERSETLLGEDPGAALALAVEAAELAPNFLTRSALFASLEACNLESVLAAEPNARFLDLALAPDGRLAAGALADGTARLWETAGGRAVHVLECGGAPVRRVAFDPAGERLATADERGALRVFDVATGELLFALENLAGPLLWVEFDGAGERLAVVSASGVIRIIGADGASIELASAPGTVGCARFALDDARLVTASLDRQGPPPTSTDTATLWDPGTGALVARLAGHAGPITWMDVGPRGERIATASKDGTVRLWSAESGAPLGLPLDLGAPVACVAFDPRGVRLACTTDAGLTSGAVLWDPATGKRTPLIGHEGSAIVHAAFRPDGARLATASHDMTIRVWDCADGRPLGTFEAFIQPVRALWSADGRRVATLSNGPWAHVWRAGDPPDVYRLRGHGSAVTWAGFGPRGERALTASEDGTLRVWNTPSRESWNGLAPEPGELLVTCVLHERAVNGAVFDGTGERALSFGADGTARIWDVATGRAAAAPFVHAVPVLDAELAPDAGRAVTVDAEGRAWSWSPGAPTRPVDLAPEGGTRRARLSPDGALVAVAGAADAVRVVDSRTGVLVRRLEFGATPGLPSGVHDVAWRPDGGELAIACADQRVRFRSPTAGTATRPDVLLFAPKRVHYSSDGGRLLVYGHFGGGSVRIQDLAAGTYVRPQVFHNGHVTSGSFSPDDAFVVTASWNGSVHVWDARTGQPFVHRAGGGGIVNGAAFSPAGGELRVIAGMADGSAFVWPVDPLPAARARKPRELEEWEVDRERRLAAPLRYR